MSYKATSTLLSALVLAATAFSLCTSAFAQDKPSQPGRSMAPGCFITSDQGQLVYPPNVLMSPALMHQTKAAPFRPTMGEAAYQAAKLAAAFGKGTKPPSIAQAISPNIAASVKAFEGLDENASADLGNTYDLSNSNGAIGSREYVEVTTDALAVYSRAETLQKTTPLSTFFNYTKERMLDPVIKYDRLWNRWVVTTASVPENAATQYLHVAISKTDDAKGPFYIYKINIAYTSGNTWDYQKIGLTQDAILFSGNVFNGGTYQGAAFFSVAKALLYNYLGFEVPAYTDLGGTLTLPVVNDQDANAYLIYNEPGTDEVGVYTATNTANAYEVTLSGPVQVDIGSTYNVPPAAYQPHSSYTLDTLDTRFGDNTVQQGGVVYATDCVDDDGYPANNLIEINGATGSAISQQYFYVSDSSDDFNLNVAVDQNGDIGVEWNSTDPKTHSQVAIYVNGALVGNSVPAPGGKKVKGSSVAFGTSGTLQPWGRYSSLSLDPTDGTTFWGTNELIESASDWSTENFHFVAQ